MTVSVYVVEDNAIKAASISSYFSDKYPLSCRTRVFGSFQSALREIERSFPDLIILDMTLPTFDRRPNGREGRMRPLGGYDLMYKMKHRSYTPSVIVLTQLETFGDGDEEITFKEITNRCEKDFPSFFLGSIYYDQGGLNWQTDLTRLVDDFLTYIEKI